VGRLLAAADVLAMPSRFEGLPLAVLEAMAAGLPVVGCAAPGVCDAVAHGVNGWLAPVGDDAELARGLLLALAEEPGRRWGEASRRRYARQFTARAMAERHEVQYAAALAPRRPLELPRAPLSAPAVTGVPGTLRTPGALPDEWVAPVGVRLARAARARPQSPGEPT
ncbi:MAG TPA: glycosyltransferase, partial [Armatimonadota bacterium]|nr:glycosyltransferase [Armatimonadota bacterium]